jgi:hypothetical protein
VSKSRGSARRGRSVVIVAALAITCGAVFLGSAGTASAGNLIVCGGKVAAQGKNADTKAKYFIQCSEDIRGYSVVSTKKFDFFGTETDVTPTTSQSATLQCEGTVPGNGFGCGVVDQYVTTGYCGSSGKPNCNVAPPCGQTASGSNPKQTTPPCNQRVSAGNTISGDVDFDTSPCLSKSKPKIWVTGTSDPLVTAISTAVPPGPDTNTVGEYSSQPFQLKVTGFTGKKCKRTINADSKGNKKK